jgi:hypothetical protein
MSLICQVPSRGCVPPIRAWERRVRRAFFALARSGPLGRFWSIPEAGAINSPAGKTPATLPALQADLAEIRNPKPGRKVDMGDTSIGQGKPGDRNENEVAGNTTPSKTFGEEGTNKTQPKPDPNAKPSDVGAGGKFVEPTPFTR